MNSEKAIQFRKWVNNIAKEYTIKGWVDNVLYLFGSLLVGFSVLVITLMQTGALNGNFRKS